MSELGAVFYRGPSLLTGDPVVGILTGLEHGSHNTKTGPMVQAWVLRPERAPMDAKRQNLDDAICGDCRHRGVRGRRSTCYVVPWLGPYNVWKAFARGDYADVNWATLAALVEGMHVRITAYGDPAALPVDVWRVIVDAAAGYTAYTHQWHRGDPRLKLFAMASADSVDELAAAQALGWRTFRVRRPHEDLVAGEVICPASDEGGHRATCQECELCRGLANPARSVAILAHGNHGVMATFHRQRPTAEA